MAAGRSESRTPERGPDPPWFPPEVDALLAFWFAQQLDALEERPLWPPVSGVEVYRFTWLRTFDPPVAVRLEFASQQARIIGRLASGAGGYDPGDVVQRTERRLSVTRARSLAARLELTGDRGGLGTDGSEWILEGVRDGRYTFRHVWTPEPGTFQDGCLSLVKASGLRVPGDVY
jgi:hypothetical protein